MLTTTQLARESERARQLRITADLVAFAEAVLGERQGRAARTLDVFRARDRIVAWLGESDETLPCVPGSAMASIRESLRPVFLPRT